MNKCVDRIGELELALNNAQQESTTSRQSESRLEKELEAARQSLRERETLVETIRQEFNRSTSLLSDELKRSRETIETMKRESQNEDLLLTEYRQRMEEKDRLIELKTAELRNEAQALLEQQNTALECLKAENVMRIHELSESFEQQLRAKDSRIDEVSRQLGQKASETERLLAELAAERELCKKKDEELTNALKRLEGSS